MSYPRFSNLAKHRTVDLSVITATLPGREGASLRQAFQSLLAQNKDYRWEWVVQIDGGAKEEEEARADLGDLLPDPRIKILANGRHLGVAASRNIALERSLGGAISYLDDDDILCENAFATMLEPLEKNPELIWSGGQLLYGFDDVIIEFESLLPAGLIQVRDLWRAWKGPNLRFPHPPSTVATRIDAARAVGGWPGLPQGDDLGFFVAASFLGPGYLDKENVYIYNQHNENTSSSEGFEATESLVRNIIWNRASALEEISK